MNIFDSSPEWCRYLLTQSPLTKRITWIRRLLRGEMCDTVQLLMHCQISCNGGGRDSRKWANYLPLWKKCLRKLLLPIFRLIRGHPWSSFLLIQLSIRSWSSLSQWRFGDLNDVTLADEYVNSNVNLLLFVTPWWQIANNMGIAWQQLYDSLQQSNKKENCFSWCPKWWVYHVLKL